MKLKWKKLDNRFKLHSNNEENADKSFMASLRMRNTSYENKGKANSIARKSILKMWCWIFCSLFHRIQRTTIKINDRVLKSIGRKFSMTTKIKRRWWEMTQTHGAFGRISWYRFRRFDDGNRKENRTGRRRPGDNSFGGLARGTVSNEDPEQMSKWVWLMQIIRITIDYRSDRYPTECVKNMTYHSTAQKPVLSYVKSYKFPSVCERTGLCK